MNSASLLSLVEELEENIDDLEENLEPLLSNALASTTKRLPLLDKAKLYVVSVYAIESLLFSYLRLNGVDAREHPIFRELARVKQYFTKLKEAEEGPVKPRENLSLNKQAAGRFIKHALAGNEKFDLERAEREAREKFLANRKLKSLESAMKEKVQPLESDDVLEGHDNEEGEIDEDDAPSSADSSLLENDPTDAHADGGTKARAETISSEGGKRKREAAFDSADGVISASKKTKKNQRKNKKKK